MLTMLPSSVAINEPSDTLVRMSHLRSIERLGAAIEPAVRSPAGGRRRPTLLDAADTAGAAIAAVGYERLSECPSAAHRRDCSVQRPPSLARTRTGVITRIPTGAVRAQGAPNSPPSVHRVGLVWPVTRVRAPGLVG